MGCIESKLAPESNPNGHLVKTYYDQIDRKTDKAVRGSTKNSYNSSCKRSTITFGGVTIARKPNSTDAEDEWISKKVKKYREKFDHRVTKKYDIKALIGRGSFSRVVRVEHIVSRQPYAIKMMDRYEGKEVFDTELSVLQRVKHKYIIQLVEVFETEDKLYMVMELATGGELFDRVISKGNFFESDAVRDLKMVIEGVAYLHSLGIAHRDLKPENLLYYHPGNDSRLMITDFGLSHILNGPDHFMNTTCGTPEYIAPEILARNLYSVQVDMWAIGVITYILLSGTMPFDDENRTRLYRKILRAKYTFAGQHWINVTLKAKDFIEKLLVLDPNVRLTAAEAIRHPWLSMDPSSASKKNLHRTISHNLTQRQSIQANSTKSAKSYKSNKSNYSLKSDRRRVYPEEIEELHRDPEVQVELASMSSVHSRSSNHKRNT